MTPLHPSIVHIPVVLTLILPFLILVFALMIKKGAFPKMSWLIILGLQITVVSSGYIALDTGEEEEDKVEKVVSKELIHEHEENAEIFVGVSVVALVLSIGSFFLKNHLSFPIQLVIGMIYIASSFLAYRTGKLGGELVYVHGAASVYKESATPKEGILPTPGMNTSESPFPK